VVGADGSAARLLALDDASFQTEPTDRNCTVTAQATVDARRQRGLGCSELRHRTTALELDATPASALSAQDYPIAGQFQQSHR